MAALTTLVTEITHDGDRPGPFVSKYLHFHRPIVPIFDNVAAARIPSMVRMNDSIRVVPMTSIFDPIYYDYAMRFYRLY